MAEIAQYRGTGKRKTSVARVILRPGDGGTWINGRSLEAYFPREALRTTATAPLRVAGVEGRFDIRARIHGGGPTGQAGALRHGIARALVEADPELRGVAQARGLPHARRPHRRAQEGRPPQGPQGAAVLEAVAVPLGRCTPASGTRSRDAGPPSRCQGHQPWPRANANSSLVLATQRLGASPERH